MSDPDEPIGILNVHSCFKAIDGNGRCVVDFSHIPAYAAWSKMDIVVSLLEEAGWIVNDLRLQPEKET